MTRIVGREEPGTEVKLYRTVKFVPSFFGHFALADTFAKSRDGKQAFIQHLAVLQWYRKGWGQSGHPVVVRGGAIRFEEVDLMFERDAK